MKLLDKLLKSFKKLIRVKSLNAAESWQTRGFDAGEYYWLFATPVHLVLQRDSFSMGEMLNLTEAEQTSLLATLNLHFKEDNLQFFEHESTWFLRLQNDPQISTVAPQTLVNRDIQAYLPNGAGATQWAQLTNEIQMLLFDHPVNTLRENQQQLSVNSVWFHGLGCIKND